MQFLLHNGTNSDTADCKTKTFSSPVASIKFWLTPAALYIPSRPTKLFTFSKIVKRWLPV